MTQLDLVSSLTTSSISRAGANANSDWFNEAIGAVELLIRRGKNFTTDNVWEILDQLPYKTHERRALGAIIRDFDKSGRIQAVGAKKSTRPICHGRFITEWKPVREPMERAD